VLPSHPLLHVSLCDLARWSSLSNCLKNSCDVTDWLLQESCGVLYREFISLVLLSSWYVRYAALQFIQRSTSVNNGVIDRSTNRYNNGANQRSDIGDELTELIRNQPEAVRARMRFSTVHSNLVGKVTRYFLQE
jgi:hypothetical protein